MSDQSRRKVLKSIALGGGAVVATKALPESWLKPVVESVLLPAHAQTSDCASSIAVSSLQSTNDFARYVAIADAQTGELIASCGSTGDLNPTVSNLAPGDYYVLGDSDGPRAHTVTITTECSSETLTYTTDESECKFLFATVSIPDGTITPGGGQLISGPWSDCGSGSSNCA